MQFAHPSTSATKENDRGLKRVVVIGAGPSGLIAAYEAQKAGYQVTIVEKANFAGGKGGTFKWKDFIIEFGPHAFHALSEEITEFMMDHSDGELKDIHIKQKLYVTDKPTTYPLNVREAIRVFDLKFKIRVLIDFLLIKVKLLFKKIPQNSFRQWGICRYGKSLYDICFGDYSERIWGVPASRLSSAFAKQKLPNLSLWEVLVELISNRRSYEDKTYLNVRRYLHHKKGMGTVYENIAQHITRNGGDIQYNSCIKTIDLNPTNNRAASVNLSSPEERTILCDYLISTVPLVDLVDYLSLKIEELVRLKASLPFRNCVIINVVLNREKFSDAHWIYLVNKKFNFNRISEPKNFSHFFSPNDKTMIMLERICSYEDEEWNWEPEAWRSLVVNDLSFFNVKEDEVKEIFLSKLEKAFPLYLLGYEEKKKKFLTKLAEVPNLISTGRYGLYLSIDMHDAMVLGKEGFHHLISNRVKEFYNEHENIYRLKRNSPKTMVANRCIKKY